MNGKIFLSIVEIRTKIVSLSTFILAYFATIAQGGVPQILPTVLLFFSVLSVDMATTALNTFFDFERGVDSLEYNQEKDKPLVHEKTPPGYALLISLGLFFLSALLGIVLVLLKGWPLLILGFLSFLVAFAYSAGPKPLSSTPFGEVFAGGALGTLLWITVQWTLQPDGTPFSWGTGALKSLPSFFFIASILAVNNACDRIGDRQAGRSTLAIVLGKWFAGPVIILPVLAYVSWFLLSWASLLPGGGLLLAPLGLVVEGFFLKKAWSLGFSHQTKGFQMKVVSQSFLFFTLLMGLGFLLFWTGWRP